MNIIIITGSWLVIIWVRFIYLICLSGVAIEDILLLGDEQWEGYNKQVKLVGVVLLIAGLLWLWSNTGVGLICFITCSIAFSTCETRSKQSDGVTYLIRCIIGICWVWSHLKELLLYIPPVAIIVFIIVACWLRYVGATQDHNDEVVNTNDVNSKHDLINRLLNRLCSLLLHIFLFYKVIIYVSRKFWARSRAPVMGLPNGCGTPDNPTAPVSAQRDNEDGSPSSSHNYGDSLNVHVGSNENNGGTQTNGAVIVAKVIQIIQNEGRRRSGCSSVVWLFVCLAIISLLSGATTTTTTTTTSLN